MKNICLALCFISALAIPARAQTTTAAAPAPAAAPAAPYLPDVYVGSGVSYDYYGGAGFALHTEVALRVTGSQNYWYSTIETTAQRATLRTGGFRVMYQQGNWILGALADGGLSYGNGTTISSFSGSPMVLYDAGARFSKGTTHFYVGFGPRIVTMGSNVQPIAEITFGKGF